MKLIIRTLDIGTAGIIADYTLMLFARPEEDACSTFLKEILAFLEENTLSSDIILEC